jgi:hypothetical protein
MQPRTTSNPLRHSGEIRGTAVTALVRRISELEQLANAQSRELSSSASPRCKPSGTSCAYVSPSRQSITARALEPTERNEGEILVVSWTARWTVPQRRRVSGVRQGQHARRERDLPVLASTIERVIGPLPGSIDL